MNQNPAAQPSDPTTAVQRRRRRSHWPVVSGVLAVFAMGLLVAGSDIFFGPERRQPAKRDPARRETPGSPAMTPAADDNDVQSKGIPSTARSETSTASALVDDDGQTLWTSPTSGPPLDLSYLPPGVQLVVALRPRALLEHSEGEKILAALGPTGEQGVRHVEQATGLPLRDLERLTIAASIDSAGSWLITIVAALRNPISLDAPGTPLPDQAHYLPNVHAGKLLVIAPQSTIDAIINLGDNPPPLRRDMERLLTHTDADRHATILVAPNFLFGEGQGIFRGVMARLRGPLFWFLGDEFSAAALSLHWDENFFAELIAVPTADTPPERAAAILAERSAEIPDRIEDYILGLAASPHGRRVVARFPAMTRKLTTYTRSGFGRDHATLRAYLPAIAGHNLLMGAELTLAESIANAAPASSAGESAPAGEIIASTNSISPSAIDALQKPTTLRFARETLESALDQLSKDIGIEIIILGPDLQSEGITKNQSFAIDLENQPAQNVLIEILRLANPDKSATGLTDPRQKLVYIVKPTTPGGPDVIHITTRAAAAQRDDKLPPAFVSDSGGTP